MTFIGRRNKMKPRSGVRNKNPQANRPQPTIPITITEATASGSVLTLTFDQPVALSATPKYTTDVAGANPVSAVKTSPTSINLTFSDSVAAATVVNVPYEDPGVRNGSGGFVFPTAFPLAA